MLTVGIVLLYFMGFVSPSLFEMHKNILCKKKKNKCKM